MSRNTGFTLIELVLVILLLGILAMFAAPVWVGKGGAETQTIADELLTRLRLVQTMNMHEPLTRCSQLVVNSPRFAHRSYQGTCLTQDALSSWSSTLLSRGRVVTASSNLQITFNGSQHFVLAFDKMGRPLGGCSGGCTIEVSDGVSVSKIKIEAEGYIHEAG